MGWESRIRRTCGHAWWCPRCRLQHLRPAQGHALDYVRSSSFAEEEARKISIRTKAALAAAKVRGVKLGGYRGAKLSPKAGQARTAASEERAERMAAVGAPSRWRHRCSEMIPFAE
jgi:hypothetical protein